MANVAAENIEKMKVRLLEEGKLKYEDYEVLGMVRESILPFDEYQELLTDRHNDTSKKVKFAVQVAVSVMVSAFCISMIAVEKDNSDTNAEGIYLPILTGILGYWLPNPDYSKILPKKNSGIIHQLPRQQESK